jgi:hypothetical protein
MGLMDKWIDDTVIDTLQPLLDDDRLERFKIDLKAVFAEAIDLGRAADLDQVLVFLDTTPSVSDRAGWREYLSEEYDVDDTAGLSPMSPVAVHTGQMACVKPQLASPGGAARQGRKEGEAMPRAEYRVCFCGCAHLHRAQSASTDAGEEV